MIGVIEDAANLYEDPNATVPIVKDYGHRNNSIWMFRVSATDGQIYAKILPEPARRERFRHRERAQLDDRLDTRREPAGCCRYKDEAPAAVAIGKGLGSATIYIVARAETDNGLYMSKHVVSTTSFVSWPEAWTPVGVTSVVRPALAEAFNGKLALATWTSTPSARIDVRLFNPANGTWHGRVPARPASQRRPQLVWDGTVLNVFFVANNRLRHTFTANDSPMNFAVPVDVANQLPVVADDYHALAFNERLHVCRPPRVRCAPAARGVVHGYYDAIRAIVAVDGSFVRGVLHQSCAEDGRALRTPVGHRCRPERTRGVFAARSQPARNHLAGCRNGD